MNALHASPSPFTGTCPAQSAFTRSIHPMSGTDDAHGEMPRKQRLIDLTQTTKSSLANYDDFSPIDCFVIVRESRFIANDMLDRFPEKVMRKITN